METQEKINNVNETNIKILLFQKHLLGYLKYLLSEGNHLHFDKLHKWMRKL